MLKYMDSLRSSTKFSWHFGFRIPFENIGSQIFSLIEQQQQIQSIWNLGEVLFWPFHTHILLQRGHEDSINFFLRTNSPPEGVLKQIKISVDRDSHDVSFASELHNKGQELFIKGSFRLSTDDRGSFLSLCQKELSAVVLGIQDSYGNVWEHRLQHLKPVLDSTDISREDILPASHFYTSVQSVEGLIYPYVYFRRPELSMVSPADATDPILITTLSNLFVNNQADQHMTISIKPEYPGIYEASKCIKIRLRINRSSLLVVM